MQPKNKFNKKIKKKGRYKPLSRKSLMKRIKLATECDSTQKQQVKENIEIPDFVTVTYLRKTGIKYKLNDEVEINLEKTMSTFDLWKFWNKFKKSFSNLDCQKINITNSRIKRKIEEATILLENKTNVLFWGFGEKKSTIEQIFTRLQNNFFIIQIDSKNKHENFLEKFEQVLKSESRKIPLGRYPREINQELISIDRLTSLYRFFIQTTHLKMLIAVNDFESLLNNPSLYKIIFSFIWKLDCSMICQTDRYDFGWNLNSKIRTELKLVFIEINTNQPIMNFSLPSHPLKNFDRFLMSTKHSELFDIMTEHQR